MDWRQSIVDWGIGECGLVEEGRLMIVDLLGIVDWIDDLLSDSYCRILD
jgi:hypothetical protein